MDRFDVFVIGGTDVTAIEMLPQIQEVVGAMAGRISAEDIGDAIHAYPTLSESGKGAFQQLASEA